MRRGEHSEAWLAARGWTVAKLVMPRPGSAPTASSAPVDATPTAANTSGVSADSSHSSTGSTSSRLGLTAERKAELLEQGRTIADRTTRAIAAGYQTGLTVSENSLVGRYAPPMNLKRWRQT